MATGRFIEASLTKKTTSFVGFWGRKLRLVELFGNAVRVKEPLTATGFFAAKGSAARGLVTQSNSGFEGEGFHGLGEGKRINFLYETDDVPAFAAAKAMPKTLGGADVERGRALVVERAQSFQRIDACGAQGNSLADDFFNARSIAYGGDVFFEDQAGHEFSLASGHFSSRKMLMASATPLSLLTAVRTAFHTCARASVRRRYRSTRRLGR